METVVTIALMSVALLALSSVIVFFYRTNANVLEQSGAISSARRGIERAMKDLREATISEEGAYPVVSAGPNTITFYADINTDSLVERIRYEFVDEVLTRYTLQPTGNPLTYSGSEVSEIISDNVRNNFFGTNIFKYFDVNGAELSSTPSPVDITFVTATIIVNINPARAPEEFTLTSSATLRNVRVE